MNDFASHLHCITCTSCTVKHSVLVLQGGAATDLMWGGRFHSSFFCSSSRNALVKELLKLVHTCKSYEE